MCRIYVNEGGARHGEKAYPLIEMAATMYMAEAGFNMLEKTCDAEFASDLDKLQDTKVSFDIDVTEKGKPYFRNLNLEFSVTNSGDMWMCAISEKPCGIDVQFAKETPYEKIAERYYKPKEIEYVRMIGESAFFQIWTRREAYGKMIGSGFWGDIPELVNDDLSLVDMVEEYRISDIEFGDGIYCSLCTVDDEPYPIILL